MLYRKERTRSEPAPSECEERVIAQLKNLNEKIILFGSLVTGNIGRGGDIDIIALFEDRDSFKNRMKKIYQDLDCCEGVDILAYNFTEFERLKDRPFFKYIQIIILRNV